MYIYVYIMSSANIYIQQKIKNRKQKEDAIKKIIQNMPHVTAVEKYKHDQAAVVQPTSEPQAADADAQTPQDQVIDAVQDVAKQIVLQQTKPSELVNLLLYNSTTKAKDLTDHPFVLREYRGTRAKSVQQGIYFWGLPVDRYELTTNNRLIIKSTATAGTAIFDEVLTDQAIYLLMSEDGKSLTDSTGKDLLTDLKSLDRPLFDQLAQIINFILHKIQQSTGKSISKHSLNAKYQHISAEPPADIKGIINPQESVQLPFDEDSDEYQSLPSTPTKQLDEPSVDKPSVDKPSVDDQFLSVYIPSVEEFKHIPPNAVYRWGPRRMMSRPQPRIGRFHSIDLVSLGNDVLIAEPLPKANVYPLNRKLNSPLLKYLLISQDGLTVEDNKKNVIFDLSRESPGVQEDLINNFRSISHDLLKSTEEGTKNEIKKNDQKWLNLQRKLDELKQAKSGTPTRTSKKGKGLLAPPAQALAKTALSLRKANSTIGRGVKVVNDDLVYTYKTTRQLLNRLKVIIAAFEAGNDSTMIRNHISTIGDILLQDGSITEETHKRLIEKYLLKG